MNRLDYSSGELVHHLFEQAAAAHRERIAVVAGPTSLTYGQLAEQAAQLGQVIAQQGIDSDLVGLSTTRGLAMVVGLLAILQAGKAYLPLNPDHPAQRLTQLVASAGLTHCLAPAAEIALLGAVGLATIAPATVVAGPPLPVGQGSAAYVLYTSGSTGEPKGVRMGHAPLVNLLRWQNAAS
ncbi:MAG: non-ribosomal peptide synthetase, partial [Hymenobacter sp.]